MPVPEASVIVRALNEERHLPALFDGLARQRERSFEVVLVDSGSTDRTREIAVGRGARLVRIAPGDFTFGRSLNVGIRESSGRFIVVASAHVRPVDGLWLTNMLRDLRADPRVAMTYGRQVGWETSKFGESLDFDRFFGPLPREIADHFFANNANSAFRRGLWERRPFDEGLPGLEDIEWARWARREGFRVSYAHDAPVHHIHEETWPQVRRRYFREGVAAKRIGWLTRRNLPVEVWGELRWLADDLATAAGRGLLPEKLSEILRFRYNKVVGTVTGVWAGGDT